CERWCSAKTEVRARGSLMGELVLQSRCEGAGRQVRSVDTYGPSRSRPTQMRTLVMNGSPYAVVGPPRQAPAKRLSHVPATVRLDALSQLGVAAVAGRHTVGVIRGERGQRSSRPPFAIRDGLGFRWRAA